MKLIILSPNLHLIFSEEQRALLDREYDVEYFTEPRSLDEISALQSDEEKIIAIDPDFCDWSVTRDNLEKIKHVKAIVLATTSFHYIDADYLKEKNIPLTNLKGFSTNAVAEQAISLAFLLARRVPLVIQNDWKIDFEKYRGIELSGKRAGIIGLGKIGRRIAEMTQAFGMDTVYWSRSSRDERFEYLELEKIIEQSDLLFLTYAQNEETDKLFTQELLKKLKKGVLIVSIAHIDHSSFVTLAEAGNIGGFACDDPIENRKDLHSNIMPGTKAGWCTDECFQRNGQEWIEAIMDAKSGVYPNRVN